MKTASNIDWFNNVCVSTCLAQWKCRKDEATNKELEWKMKGSILTYCMCCINSVLLDPACILTSNHHMLNMIPGFTFSIFPELYYLSLGFK